MTQTTAELPDFDQWWNYDQPAETEGKFRALLVKPATKNDLLYQIELLTQIARTEGLQRRFVEAHKTLDTAEALLPDGMSRARIRYLLERGRIFNSSQQPDIALPFFREAWDMGLTVGEDGFAVDAAHMVAIVAEKEAKMEWNSKALALAERSENPQAQKWIGSLYNNIGWTLHEHEKYTEALEIFERAVAFRKRQGNAGLLRIAEWSVARTLRSLGRIEEALQAQQALQENGHNGPYVAEEIAECLQYLGKPEEAQPYFAIAYESLSQDPWFVESEAMRLQRLKELAQPSQTSDESHDN